MKRVHGRWPVLALALIVLVVRPAHPQRQEMEYEGSAALGLALRQLGTTKRVLMIGAHPDDESTQILSTLALGQGAEVAYLSLTRGEGGQNGIGPELGEALGLVRTEELLAARRLDGARQYFTRAYDYGFSKNAEEAFRHWPRDSLLLDVVAVIREFRPDLIISVWSGTPRDGHGQHEASGILAAEGFEAAGGADRFPRLTARGLAPHTSAKLYHALWSRDDAAGERLFTGGVDPLLGRSHFQVAMASRSRHRSQDMGRELTAGPQSSALRLVGSRTGRADSSSLFAGVDTTLAQELRAAARTARGAGTAEAVRLLARYQDIVEALRSAFNPLRPDALVPELAGALRLLDSARGAVPAVVCTPALLEEFRAERAELTDAISHAARIQVDAVSDTETIVPGQTFLVTLGVWNGGGHTIALRELTPRLPSGWRAEPADSLTTVVPPSTLIGRRFRVTVPKSTRPSEPYFLRARRRGDLYVWPEGEAVGQPFDPAPVTGHARLVVEGVTIERDRTATFRTVDKMQGELRRPVRVVPAVSVVVEPALSVVPLGGQAEALRFSVRLRAGAPAGIAGTLQIRAPRGWRITPHDLPLRFSQPGEVRVVEVELQRPTQLAEGEFSLDVAFQAESGERFSRGYSLVDYPHIEPRPIYRSAGAVIRSMDVRLPRALRVGYVAGPGDEVPTALSQLGVEVALLDPETLASGDLRPFDAIVTGIRAYEVRPDLVAHNRRLLDYVREGGTMIVQYNKYEYARPGIAPYPVQMARPHDRVTDEAATVHLLAPDHPALSWPNRITARDFEGWQQERGLYFLNRWDERFVPLLAMADPGEEPKRGGLLVAEYGKGRYVYTGLALFRQLPAGVPGAYRLFANLLSLGVEK